MSVCRTLLSQGPPRRKLMPQSPLLEATFGWYRQYEAVGRDLFQPWWIDDSMILPSSSEYTMVHTSLSKVSMCFRIFWCYVIAIRSYLFFLPRCSASISTRTSEKYLPGHLDATYCTNALNKFIIRHGFEIFDKVLSPFRLTFISVTYHFWCCLMALQVYVQKPCIWCCFDSLTDILSVYSYQLSSSWRVLVHR